MPSVVLGLDRALRTFGGCPTYALTDNEKTVSVDQVCGIAVRNPLIVDVRRHTAWHEPLSSHIHILEAAAGRELLERSYTKAAELGFVGHEFGDAHVVLS